MVRGSTGESRGISQLRLAASITNKPRTYLGLRRRRGAVFHLDLSVTLTELSWSGPINMGHRRDERHTAMQAQQLQRIRYLTHCADMACIADAQAARMRIRILTYNAYCVLQCDACGNALYPCMQSHGLG